MAFSDEDCGDAPPSIVSFSVSIRSSRRKRSRLARLPVPPSTCEESAHYPVFNPKDPRHNPALGRNVCLEDVDSLAHTVNPSGSIRWMQGLPGRSLRRARSGLQALRSGLHRRPVRSADDGHLNNGLWSSSNSAEGSINPHERLFSSTVSEASTEEDYEFGTDLYRTGCNHPDSKTKGSRDKRIDVSCPSYIQPSHPAPLLASSTGVGPLVLLAETTADALSDESSPTTTEPNFPNPDYAPATTSDEKCTLDSLKAFESSASDDDSHAPVQELSHRNSSVHSIPQTAAHLGEVEPVTPLNTENRRAAVEETNMNCASRRTSRAIRRSQIEQVPCGETEATVRADEPITTGTIPLECHTNGVAEEDIGPMNDVETTPLRKSGDTAPAVELGGLEGLEQYLSLNTLGASKARESKTSDEEPSPNSLSEDDRDSRLSPWLPADKGDRTSLLSLRDEYFFVDGKSPDLRPDRGDNPIKGERGFAGDGGLHSGPGLDRNRSIRTQEIPEIIGPGGPMGIPSPRPFRGDREGSDSTEEYLVTYSLLHRHYFS
ncbi:hypothetical protein BJX76DRAFT_327494 [Aspergillus varians]